MRKGHEIPIIGENYPKVGDTFYWEDKDGHVNEDTCMKIENENDPNIETMYFTYISPNGGGVFVTESDLIDPLSIKIEIYKRKKLKETIEKIAKNFDDKVFRDAIFPILRRFLDEDKAYLLLDTLSNTEEYEI